MNEIRNTISILRHAVYMTSFILLVCGAICLLFSCELDYEQGLVKPEQSPDGELVTVKFELNGMGYNADVVGIRKAPLNPSEGGKYLSTFGGVRESTSQILLISPPSGELEGALYMYATLTEDDVPIMLRAASPLNANSQVRIVAYSGTPEVKVDHADFQTTGSSLDVNPVGPSLTLPSGTYRFVAYSFHNSAPLAPFADSTAVFSSQDVLWGDTIETVGSTNNTVLIRTHHKLSQVKVFAQVDASAGTSIDNISGAAVSNVDSRLVVQNGNLHPVSNSTVPVSWIGGGSGSNWLSNPMLVHTNGNPPSLTINSVVINSTVYNGSYTVNYSTPLAAGKEYTLNVNFTKVPPTLSVDPTSLFFTYNNSSTPQTVRVTTNQSSWSVSGNPGWLTITPTSGSGTSFTVSPNSTTFDMRTATLTVSAGNATPVTVNVVQYGDIGGGAAIIYYDSISKILRVGRWGYEITDIKQITLFRFGGVIGVDNTTLISPVGANFSSAIKFNPATNITTFESTNDNNSLTDYDKGAPNYYTTPSAWNGRIDNSPKVSDNAYHTLANVKAGRGDPCRLIGLTREQIQGFQNNQQLWDAEQGWRSPSIDENVKYIKGPGPWSSYTVPTGYTGSIAYTYTQHNGPTWNNTQANFYENLNNFIGTGTTNYYSNPNVFWTPVVQATSPNKAGEKHPTPGWRHADNTGIPYCVGTQGDFWSSTPFGISFDQAIGYNTWVRSTSMHPADGLRATFYLSVRCVRMW